jgi:hypothetical protein
LPDLSLRLACGWAPERHAAIVSITTPTAAAIGVLSALGGAAAGVALPSPDAPGIAPVPVATPVTEVRTHTIHRTIRIVRHERVHHRRKPVPVAPVTRVSAPAPAAPAVAAAPPPRQTRPLVSRTSGHGRGGDGEHEGGDD